MKNDALSALGRRATEPPISWLMHAALSRPRLISLAAGFTDPVSLPVTETRTALNLVLRSPRTGRPALQYGSTAGEPKLRQLTARHLRHLDASSASSSSSSRRSKSRTRMRMKDKDENYCSAHLLITSGSQQLLYMTAEALCDAGDIVLVEDPTYFVFLGILQSRGLRARSIRLQRDGLDLAHLEQVLQSLRRRGELRRAKFLYLVSYFQNPTGITTGFDKKRGILKLLKKYEQAAGHPLYLLEDAAYRELRFAGRDVPSALSVRGASDRVIYAGTFSKPFATGARVGYGILPEPVFSAVKHIKGNHDFGTANLLQHLTAQTLASGSYARHVTQLRRRYAHKAGVMKQAIKMYFPPEIEWWEPEGGLYFWARLPRQIPTGVKSEIFRSALRGDVLYVPGAICYADDPTRRKPDHEMRISFGNASEVDIHEAIKRLGNVLQKFL